ncbi:MYND-type domain-containing protein [Mycena indigotica]|uniref:MYND-type domain-containing protein n=1 Tax=Mycena indigotica TaxID=2126181 RepID=A0A8H6SMK2_9AGAR|nr:MYND-type domain-containing protein [Mycena indigotica]KAF7302089.1 MYND-type domain-containing protein [Mycena indigotica]
MNDGNTFVAPLKLCQVCSKRGELRQCANCKTVQYCSRECQKAHWPKHKVHCKQSQQRSEEFAAFKASNPIFAQHVQSLGKFSQIWSDALFGWAACAVDLAVILKQDLNYLEKHSFFVTIERRSDVAANAPVKTAFEVIDAGMRADEEIMLEFERMELKTGFTEPKKMFQSQKANPYLLRMVVVQPSLCLSIYLSELIPRIMPSENIISWANDKILSSTLAALWLQSCRDSIRIGNTSGHLKLVKDVRQAIGVD